MLNWFKGNKHSKYREILLNAFPRTLKKDVESVLDILPFALNDIKLFDGRIHKVENLIHPDYQTVLLEGENLLIPNRLYFNEPELEKEQKLTNNQKAILNCIYLRHHNGYVRQSRLEKVNSNEYWITPFTFKLLGEYIFEILEVLDEQLDNSKLENYKRFAIENPKYYHQTESRMISYWNEYYRKANPKLNRYVGRIIFDQIKFKTKGLCLDEITEIEIDENERLLIKPKRSKFTLIYRTATKVHWDEKFSALCSPKLREWNYLNWYQHIVNGAEVECNTKLIITARTVWTNIKDDLKKKIIENQK
ncbi:hypothetical protein KBJ98_03345 [Flavobacterium sp. F-328]|uniref:Integron Cassette Protein Hfx-Cass5 domain-containing protein n=1 Tax=Flavobacterium erciyesense TaxID=2825842 RepID=A0ABS5D148_9FLAO|nr:hypothetical protein [Flavobacterium erciyesense]MBQ0907734.1 hypothetical protein [Flavobacterium erciyesense]